MERLEHTEDPSTRFEWSLLAVAFGIDTVLIWAVFAAKIPAAVFLIGHLLLGAGCLWISLRRIKDSSLLVWGSTFLFVSGVTGSIFLLVMFLARLRKSRSAAQNLFTWMDEWTEEVAEPDVLAFAERFDNGRVCQDFADELGSLNDAIQYGSQKSALQALRIIGQRYSPEFAPALSAGLVSPDAAVRVMAATVLAKLKAESSEKLARIRQGLEAKPSDKELTLSLAEWHLENANCGYLDDDVAIEHLVNARTISADLEAEGDALSSRIRAVRERSGALSLVAGRFMSRSDLDKYSEDAA